MLLELIDKNRAAHDPHFHINVLEDVANPLDPDGNGQELDIFARMAERLTWLPGKCPCPTAVFEADESAIAMMRRQAKPKRAALSVEEGVANLESLLARDDLDPNLRTLVEGSLVGIKVGEEGSAGMLAHMAMRFSDDYVEGDPPAFRGIRIVQKDI